MRNNTASNPSAPGGKPKIDIIHERLTNPTREQAIKGIVDVARQLVESMSRPHLEGLAGGLLAEILMAQLMGESEITVKHLNELLKVLGVHVTCGRERGEKS